MFAWFMSLVGCKVAYEQPCTYKSIYEAEAKSIDGKMVSLEEYKGKLLLFVNVASKCGFTPQYAELETLYQRYKDEGLVILGFPANNFLWQEPGDDASIKSFCSLKYNVTFPMFSKISVKGKDCHPIYQFLTQKSLNGSMDCKVKWNFQKILVDRTGRVVACIAPKASVLADENEKLIQKYLRN